MIGIHRESHWTDKLLSWSELHEGRQELGLWDGGPNRGTTAALDTVHAHSVEPSFISINYSERTQV